MSDAVRPEDDPGFAGKLAIVTGGGAPDDGIGNAVRAGFFRRRRAMSPARRWSSTAAPASPAPPARRESRRQ
jgi:hypothetical protein